MAERTSRRDLVTSHSSARARAPARAASAARGPCGAAFTEASNIRSTASHPSRYRRLRASCWSFSSAALPASSFRACTTGPGSAWAVPGRAARAASRRSERTPASSQNRSSRQFFLPHQRTVTDTCACLPRRKDSGKVVPPHATAAGVPPPAPRTTPAPPRSRRTPVRSLQHHCVDLQIELPANHARRNRLQLAPAPTSAALERSEVRGPGRLAHELDRTAPCARQQLRVPRPRVIHALLHQQPVAGRAPPDSRRLRRHDLLLHEPAWSVARGSDNAFSMAGFYPSFREYTGGGCERLCRREPGRANNRGGAASRFALAARGRRTVDGGDVQSPVHRKPGISGQAAAGAGPAPAPGAGRGPGRRPGKGTRSLDRGREEGAIRCRPEGPAGPEGRSRRLAPHSR